MNFKNFDIFSQEFSFSVSKSTSKYKTKLGASLTILCISVIVGGLVTFTSDYLDTENPRVTISQYKVNESPKINLVENQFIPILSVIKYGMPMSPEEALRTMTPIIVRTRFSEDPENPLGFKVEELGRMKFVDCREAKNAKYDNREIALEGGSTIFYDLGLIQCPEDITNEEFWSLEGSGSQLPFVQIHIRFLPCSLEDQTQCASVPELAPVILQLSTVSLTYNLKKINDPVSKLFSSEKLQFKIMSDSSVTLVQYFKKVEIFDETKDFSRGELKKEFYSLGNSISTMGMRNPTTTCPHDSLSYELCHPYILVSLKGGSDVEKIKRIYPKFLSMASELGGFGDLIFIILGFFYFFYNNFYLTKELKNEIMDDNSFEALKKYGNVKHSTKKNFSDAKSIFLEKNKSGVDILKKSSTFDLLAKTMLGPRYYRATLLISFLESLEDAKRGRSNPKEDDNSLNTLEQDIEIILKDRPSCKVKKSLRDRLKSLLGVTLFFNFLGR